MGPRYIESAFEMIVLLAREDMHRMASSSHVPLAILVFPAFSSDFGRTAEEVNRSQQSAP